MLLENMKNQESMWKKILIWTLGIIMALFIVLFIVVKIISEDIPKVNPSAAGDALATEMMSALGKAGWDTHGLPIELGVEKELGITKEDIGKSISVEE